MEKRVSQISDIGSDISVTMTDGHSSNMSLFNKKILKNSDQFVQNEEKLDGKIFMSFDPTQLFKNVYNNWLPKINFQCPTFITDHKKKDMLASFLHINELYEPEKGKHLKMAYKISEQVLHPQVIEKSSVKMAEAIFHESTINDLKYYHGYNHFDDSASFTKIIRYWFNTLNVKIIDYGVRKSLIMVYEKAMSVEMRFKGKVKLQIFHTLQNSQSGWNLGKENTSQMVCHNKHLMQLSVLAKPS